MLHTLPAVRRLDRLYFAASHLVLDGESVDPLLCGACNVAPCRFRPAGLYLDASEPRGPQQSFAVYDRAAGDAPIDSPRAISEVTNAGADRPHGRKSDAPRRHSR